jgi:hypothetical protein
VKKMRTSAREVPQVEAGGRHLRHDGQAFDQIIPGLSGSPGCMISAGSVDGIYAGGGGSSSKSGPWWWW